LAADVAEKVYVGADSEMPMDGSKLFAINPTRIGAGYLVPKTFREAFVELDAIIPRWQRIAMALGKGDDECSVIVNGIPYTTLLFAWVEDAWRLSSADYGVSKALRDAGINHPDMMIQALHGGYCEYIKRGSDAGEAEILKYSGM
jgi:hypothetical protein